jgi:hypothetical protein
VTTTNDLGLTVPELSRRYRLHPSRCRRLLDQMRPAVARCGQYRCLTPGRLAEWEQLLRERGLLRGGTACGLDTPAQAGHSAND